MKTEQMKRMCKRTIDFHKLDIKHEDVDTILDMCDDMYQEELELYLVKQAGNNNIFLKALGKLKYNEIKNTLKG